MAAFALCLGTSGKQAQPGCSFPHRQVNTNKASLVAGPWAATLAGGWSRKDGGPAVCGDREAHCASARRDADAAPRPYTPQNEPMSASAPSPSQPGGMCKIKPLILLPFNPPCAAAAPTSSRSPPYLIKVSAAAPQECRPGYCIPRSARQPLHPAPAPLTRPRSSSQVPARRKTSRAASPAAKPPREEPEHRRRVGGGRRWCHAWPGRHGQIPPQ